MEVFEHFVFFLHNFENFEKSCQLDQFVHSSYSGNSDDFIDIVRVHQEHVKGNDCYHINEKPASNVGFGDGLSICDQIKIFVIEAGIEYLANINKEHNVYKVVNLDPASGLGLNKG